MNVWRIHLKNDIDANHTRNDLIEYCFKESLIGVGWPKVTIRTNNAAELKEDCLANYGQKSGSAGFKALNAMRKMEVNDLIWSYIKEKSEYYLCRVTDTWINSIPSDTNKFLDISNYVNVEWLKIGLEQNVPGKVINSFRPNASAQQIHGVEDISKFLWNKYAKEKLYKFKNSPDANLWLLFSPEEIEELVLLYLQVEKHYFVYTSTAKATTKAFECLLVDEKGKYAYPQVKSGKVTLNASDFEYLLQYEPSSIVILFSESESYILNNANQSRFVCLTKKEIETFIKKKSNLLPKTILEKIELLEEILHSTSGN